MGMENFKALENWTVDEDLFFSPALTLYMHSIKVFTLGDLVGNMEKVINRMEADDRVDLLPEFEKHLIRITDMMDYATNAKEQDRSVVPELIRGKRLQEVGYSLTLCKKLSDHHIYTLGCLMDCQASWSEILG